MKRINIDNKNKYFLKSSSYAQMKWIIGNKPSYNDCSLYSNVCISKVPRRERSCNCCPYKKKQRLFFNLIKEEERIRIERKRGNSNENNNSE